MRLPRPRFRLRWMMIAVAVVAIPILAASTNAPTRTQGSQCLFCSRLRLEIWRWGIKGADQISNGARTDMVDRLVGPCRKHRWALTSRETYGWFTDPMTACGAGDQAGVEVLDAIGVVEARGDRVRASELLKGYHALVDRGASQAKRRAFAVEVEFR